MIKAHLTASPPYSGNSCWYTPACQMCTGADGENTHTHTHGNERELNWHGPNVQHWWKRDAIPCSFQCWGHISQSWWYLLLPIRTHQNPLVRSSGFIRSNSPLRWIILIFSQWVDPLSHRRLPSHQYVRKVMLDLLITLADPADYPDQLFPASNQLFPAFFLGSHDLK